MVPQNWIVPYCPDPRLEHFLKNVMKLITVYFQGKTRSGPILSVSETFCSGGLEKETILMGSGWTARRNRRLYKLYGDSLYIFRPNMGKVGKYGSIQGVWH